MEEILMKRQFLLIAAMLFVAAATAAAQNKVSDLATFSAAEINDRVEKGLPGFEFPKADESSELKKISYTTTDAKGKREQVSGLLVLPSGGAPKGLVVYMHGTTWDYKNAPSYLTKNKESVYAEILVFAAAGYAVAAPDYIGLGDSKPTHPYPLNIVNGRSGADIIKPVRDYAKSRGYALGERLFVTGYSEGGGTAMGMVKLLEDAGETVYRAAPSSGPYDLTGVTRDFLLADVKGEDIVIRAFLLGYTISYFKDAFGIKTSDYFSKRLSTTVNMNFKRGKSDKSIGIALVVMGAIGGGTKSRDNMMTPRFIEALENTDMNDPVIRELGKNNVYDWKPKAEMLIQSLATDRVVDPRNAAVAMEHMRRRGATRRTLRHLEVNDEKLDHGSFAIQATYNAIRFFEDGFDAVPEAR
jgi:acetyl esterase/lipase